MEARIMLHAFSIGIPEAIGINFTVPARVHCNTSVGRNVSMGTHPSLQIIWCDLSVSVFSRAGFDIDDEVMGKPHEQWDGYAHFLVRKRVAP